ncbi:hypothetical protein A3J41_02790 [candidate division TM6 bacterium RIFCSPHIGHO2_12_FULL_38_8]|nr:MAG: hypothetical protein A3J41_02790 [candidate division TM6 bacterium RIFCSPHIGHO2_12_FULL_38_8]
MVSKKLLFSFLLSFIMVQAAQEEGQIFSLIQEGDPFQLKQYLENSLWRINIEEFSNRLRMTPLQQAVSLYNINFRRPTANNFDTIARILLFFGANPDYRHEGWMKSARSINPNLIAQAEEDFLAAQILAQQMIDQE